MRHFNELLITF